mmetsp:Transcript_87696/g.272569  ORF Transcript_87696/g.272569 Transcript_87696/m.272569 type:complete len:211 (+) Transcript_87696:795-1427(+)
MPRRGIQPQQGRLRRRRHDLRPHRADAQPRDERDALGARARGGAVVAGRRPRLPPCLPQRLRRRAAQEVRYHRGLRCAEGQVHWRVASAQGRQMDDGLRRGRQLLRHGPEERDGVQPLAVPGARGAPVAARGSGAALRRPELLTLLPRARRCHELRDSEARSGGGLDHVLLPLAASRSSYRGSVCSRLSLAIELHQAPGAFPCMSESDDN